MTIQTDPLPTILDGIPLQLTELALQLDHGEFQIAPEGCEPLTISGTLTSTQGRTAPIFASTFSPDPQETSTACISPPAPIVAPLVVPTTATVLLASKRIVTTSRGRAAIKLTCTGTATCHGRLTLAVKAKPRIASRQQGRRPVKLTTIASAAFSIPPSKTTVVGLQLTAVGRALLSADHGRLVAMLTLAKSSPAPAQSDADSVQLVRPAKSGAAEKRPAKSKVKE